MTVHKPSYSQASALLPEPYKSSVNRRTSPKYSNTVVFRVLQVLFLVSAAATLLHLVPTPWSLLRSSNTQTLSVTKVSIDPSAEWKDNIWPLRPPTQWDISTDFPYPRRLEYDVQEGTWLRLDVHPKTGDIVFDMLGDLYCLPAASYAQENLRASHLTEARPVLRGIPHDSDPHFSSEGDRIVFRSDAELGVENIWVMKWTGCDVMDLRSAPSVLEGYNSGDKETPDGKTRRLMWEGRFGGTFRCHIHS